MSFDKIVGKAKNLANDPKVRDALKSDKAEQVSDSILDKAAGIANKVTGDKHADSVKKVRDQADSRIGNEGAGGGRGNGTGEDRKN